MRTLTVSFFGHRHMKTPLQTEQNLEKIISHLLQENDFSSLRIKNDKLKL